MNRDGKSFHTFDELVELLASRGVMIDGDTRTILQRESYYAVVNGYKDLFLDHWATGNAGDDRYKTGTRFSEIYRLYTLDRDLRSTFLPALLMAETTLKTIIVHVFCECFPSRDSYLDPSNYDQRPLFEPKVSDVIRTFEHALKIKAGRHPKDFIDHYLSKYEYVPFWVLANFLTFGSISKFYAVLGERTQTQICREFLDYAQNVRGRKAERIEPHVMKQTLRRLGDFRNICAHEERFYCATVGKNRNVYVKDLLTSLEIVLPSPDYDRLLGAVESLLNDARADFTTISIVDIVSSMGYKIAEPQALFLK